MSITVNVCYIGPHSHQNAGSNCQQDEAGNKDTGEDPDIPYSVTHRDDGESTVAVRPCLLGEFPGD